jgi:hypothetical protein
VKIFLKIFFNIFLIILLAHGTTFECMMQSSIKTTAFFHN